MWQHAFASCSEAERTNAFGTVDLGERRSGPRDLRDQVDEWRLNVPPPTADSVPHSFSFVTVSLNRVKRSSLAVRRSFIASLGAFLPRIAGSSWAFAAFNHSPCHGQW